jgi:Arc/MetJ-type ribon-helix-helix transcriptional regulator
MAREAIVADRTTKVTYALPTELVDQVRSVVREGAAPSYSAFVERALREQLRQARQEMLAASFKEAAEDPLFLADNEQVENDFHHADAESARSIP